MAQIKTKFLENSAITTAKINDGAITSAKLNATLELPTGATVAASPTFGDDTTKVATTAFVQDAVAGIVSGTEWQDSVIDKDLTSPPGSPATGDRYLLGLDTTANLLSGAWAGEDGNIAEYNGATWDFTTPTAGMAVLVDDETTVMYRFGTTLWASFSFESTTASTGLVKVGVDIRLDSSSAGAGLGFSAGVLSANVDDSTIEINTDTLRVKDLGITTAKLANNSVTEGKLDAGVDAQTFLIATGYAAASGTVIVGDTIQAALQKIEGKVNAIDDSVPAYQSITIDGTMVTNQYFDLAAVAETHSIHLQVVGGPVQRLTSDYTISYTGGAGGVTRISFAGDLATGGNAALVASDVVLVRYTT